MGIIAVTGATGKLGQHVVRGLSERVPAAGIVAVVRSLDKARDLSERGIDVREADYDRPNTLDAALRGVEKVLLISSSELGRREAQHKAVVEAAKRAGVKLLAYTSILRADTSKLALASDHKATEEYIRASGLPFVFLRNGWYFENQTEALQPVIEHGVLLGAAREGRFASAARSDYAAAAVKVLTGNGYENKIYELAGDHSFALPELAAEVCKQAGKPVRYHDLPEKEYAAALAGFGLPGPLAGMLADADACAAKGELNSTAADLRELIGRPTVTLAEAVKAAVVGK